MTCPTCRGLGMVDDEDMGPSICWQCRGAKVIQTVLAPDPPLSEERLRYLANAQNVAPEMRSMANELLDLRYLLRHRR